MRSTFIALGVIAAFPTLLALPAQVWADTTINVVQNNKIGGWGDPPPNGTLNLGQSVTVPPGENYLTSFTLNFDWHDSGTVAQEYKAYVYTWTGAAVTGPPLFSSAVLMAPDGLTAVKINTGDLAVTPGQQYALLFSALGLPSSGSDYFFAWNSQDTYTGGEMIYNNGNSFDDLATNTWNNLGSQGDLAFTATFASNASPSVAPEPGSLALLLPVMGTVGMVIRKRRKK